MLAVAVGSILSDLRSGGETGGLQLYLDSCYTIYSGNTYRHLSHRRRPVCFDHRLCRKSWFLQEVLSVETISIANSPNMYSDA
jgi:hypothetical protein